MSISNSRSTCSRVCQEVTTVMAGYTTLALRAGTKTSNLCGATYVGPNPHPVQQLQSTKVHQ